MTFKIGDVVVFSRLVLSNTNTPIEVLDTRLNQLGHQMVYVRWDGRLRWAGSGWFKHRPALEKLAEEAP